MIKRYVITKMGVRFASKIFETELDALSWLQAQLAVDSVMDLVDMGFRVVLKSFSVFESTLDSTRGDIEDLQGSLKDLQVRISKAKEIEAYLVHVGGILGSPFAQGVKVVLIDACSVKTSGNEFCLLDLISGDKVAIKEGCDYTVIQYLCKSVYTLEDLSDFRSQPLSKGQWRELWDGCDRDENGNLLV